MESVLLLIFGGMICTMLLGMLYGERLSLIGLFDGEWFAPFGVVAQRMWDGFWEAVDQSLEFVLLHLSWVVAAASGVTGLILIAFMIGGGVTADAAAFHRDAMAPLRSGGVMDRVTQVTPIASRTQIVQVRSSDASSHLIAQTRTADYLVFGRPEYSPIRPTPRRPIEGSIGMPPASITDRPMLDLTFRRLGSSVIRSELNPNVVTHGRLVDSLPDTRFIDRIVNRLRRDNWRESFGLSDDGLGLPQDVVSESSARQVRELETQIQNSMARVRITPGVSISEQDLRVEKVVPEETSSGDLTVQVSLTNLLNTRIDGLLVREFLPPGTKIRGMDPVAVYRDDTLTWLVDGLRPGEERVLRFQVIPEIQSEGRRRQTLFESLTEVSAVTAVTARTLVAPEELPADPFPEDRSRRERAPLPDPLPDPLPAEPAATPDLRLTIEEPQTAARVNEWTQILFTLTNQGTADARSIELRLTLDDTLDHFDLLNNPEAGRVVFVDVDRVAVGQTRRFRLEVRPRSPGVARSLAELSLGGTRLDRRTFRLTVAERDTAGVPINRRP